ncbi:hypothetical protein IQ226_09645 [Dolichospermum sp. LEGE 00240]|uniref:hypothetical protein n=1 Tax=Dolichospermum sp. LEGE 00240 TaxID=1828603 RepID=UPI00187DDF5B|nr:hypothetical protein [Dolichospermum sp. LEGE 00240]MBE9249425.1 hypothetical protein [Dolichospermum sp. LEGE 00240]
MRELIELGKIRDDFQKDLRDWVDIAHTFIEFAKRGMSNMNSNASSDLKIFTHEDKSLKLETLNRLSYNDMILIYVNHKGAIAELIYGRMLQRWYNFLNQIIEQIVKYHFANVKSYPNIYNINKIKIDFSQDDLSEKLPDFINRFDKINNIDKIEVVEQCLKQNIDEELKQEIKKAIITRNLLEHNQGIIRKKDIEGLGSNSIKLFVDEGSIPIQEKDFTEGERVEITIYEIFCLKETLYNTSKILITE